MNLLKFAIAFCALPVTISAPAFAGDVTVTINGVQAGKGDIYVSLQKQNEFMQNRGSYGVIVQAPKAAEQKVVIKDVAAGEYSIAVWHDTNGDGAFTRAENGVPLDGWTMVNASALRGPPVWDQIRFLVPVSDVATTLTMIYPQ